MDAVTTSTDTSRDQPGERPSGALASGAGGRASAVPLSIAPMMDRTNRHFRFFLRQITRESLLYTEMVTTGAVLHGDRERHLGFHPSERPLVLQLGGADPGELAACARLAADRGYDEVNLNVGCPSDRVQQGDFGVGLMGDPPRVARAVAAMREAVDLPVTVKHRIGFDELDDYDHLSRFVTEVARAGCDRFTVHARKAWLTGLNPKENRNVPPLRYGDVHRLKAEHPELLIEINGGFTTLDAVEGQLAHVDGVMVGRAAYHDPYFLAPADRRLFGADRPVPNRRQVVEALLPYVEEQCAAGIHLTHVTRHVLGLFAGRPGARAWRRTLSERAHRPGAGPEVLEAALEQVPREVQEEQPEGVPRQVPPEPARP